jgi:uncharacterized protein
VIYLDACALLALSVQRDPVDDLVDFLKQHPETPIGSSAIGFMEAVRGAAEYGQYPNMLAELQSQYAELTVTAEIIEIASTLPRRIRSLDALHLATALSIVDYLTAFVSYDRRLLEAARDHGLPAASPGMVL